MLISSSCGVYSVCSHRHGGQLSARRLISNDSPPGRRWEPPRLEMAYSMARACLWRLMCRSTTPCTPALPAGSSRDRWGPCTDPSSSGPSVPPAWNNMILMREEEERGGEGLRHRDLQWFQNVVTTRPCSPCGMVQRTQKSKPLQRCHLH